MTCLLLARCVPRHALLCAAALCGLAGGAVNLTGCASPGIPRPPSLYLPATITDLAAMRIGDRVELSWTAPTRTTDGLELTGSRALPTAVEVCRDVVTGAAADESGCTPVLRVAGHAGASQVVDRVPAGLRDEAARSVVLAYRLRVLNSSGRGAEPSARTLVACGPAVEEVVGFSAKETRRGVLLQWSGADEGTVEVLRTSVDAPGRVWQRVPGKQAATMVRLRAEADGARGMLDADVIPDATYTYRAQRVRAVVGEMARSEPSAPVTVKRRDSFPPEPPTGLAGVPGGSASRPTIDLSWRAGGEAGLRGYLVYRREAGSGAWRRITAGALSGPAFRDLGVAAGGRYEYRVTAIDGRGNESAPSETVVESADGFF